MGCSEVKPKFQGEVQPKFQDEVQPKFQDELQLKLQDEVQPTFQDELQLKLQDEVQPKFQDELQLKLQDEVQPTFQDEVQPKFQDEVLAKFQNEVQPKLSQVTTAAMLQDLPLELHEHILLEAIISDIRERSRDRKLFRCAWKESAGRMAERLRNVCPQWDYVLTTDLFQKKLHGIIDKYPQVEIGFQVQATGRHNDCITVTKMNDVVFSLCHPPWQQEAHIKSYERNDLKTVERSIQLPGVSNPWNLVACSVSNCLYMLHQTTRDTEILRVSTEGQQFKVSHFITCAPKNLTKMSISADGSLIVIQGSAPYTLTTYNTDASLQHQMELNQPISHRTAVISKSDGNFILVTKRKLTEIGREGNTLREYSEPSGEYLYCAIDQYDRIVAVDEDGGVRLLDSEFNSVQVKFRLPVKYYQGSYLHFYRMSYNRKWNEFVAFECAAYCVSFRSSQCLTVFNLTENYVPDDTLNK